MLRRRGVLEDNLAFSTAKNKLLITTTIKEIKNAYALKGRRV